TLKTPVRLTASTCDHSAGERSRKRWRMLMPALLIRMSTPPSAASTWLNAAATARSSTTSATTTSVSAANLFLICLAPRGSRSMTSTRHASSRNRATAPASSTNSPTATASTSAVATPASGYRVVLTTSTADGSEIFLYDSASNAPQQLVSLGAGAPEARFVSPDKIAYVDTGNNGSSRVMTFDLTTRTTSVVISATSYIPALAYKHD